MRTIPERTRALTTTEAAVLGLLVARGGRSGYDLTKAAHAGVGYIWTPARSQIYAVLPRLLAGGLAARRAVAQETRPDKQIYRATRSGERAFRSWLDDEAWRSEDELLLKVFFAGFATREALLEQVESYRAREQARLGEYREIEARIADVPASRHGYLTLRFGLAAARARIRWADEALRELRDGR